MDEMAATTHDMLVKSAAGPRPLTNFYAQAQGSHDEDVRSSHAPHGLPAIDSQLPAVQIFINV